MPTLGGSGGSGGSGGVSYRWISLPGGGGTWWAPAPDSTGGYWWMPTSGGGYWYKAPAGHCQCHWVPLPGGGGAWWAATPDDPDGLWWWPDEGVWREAPPTQPSGSLPMAPPGIAPISQDILLYLDALLGGPLPAGPSGGTILFDMLASGLTTMQPMLDQATETMLIANAIVQFQGVNMAPFPRRNDPRYLLTGDVMLGCKLDGATVSSMAFAMNGENICEATRQGDTWKAQWNSRVRPDGDYFLTAHEVGPNHTLGKMVAKGYARIRNVPDRDAPCSADWIDGI
jgi:hypothetical protein